VMARIIDRVRRYDPTTSATGVVAIGDAAACTNPSIGRGASTALLYAVCLRDVVRDVGTAQRRDLLESWSVVAGERVDPYVNDTLTVDRHRRAQIEAEITGESYEPTDPAWKLGRALMAAAPHDPEILRGAMDVAGMLARGVDVLRRPGLLDAIARVGPVAPLPGPTREELLEVVGQPAMEVA
jgi:2-polyprenyl-6-methoxyphenol hydroxylase-like FAD-dependent oxidoreductase